MTEEYVIRERRFNSTRSLNVRKINKDIGEENYGKE